MLMYTIGFPGLLWLKRKFRLSDMTFAMLFMLFNFNGHILAHYAVGHATWGGYFLFPWFVIQVIRLLGGKRSWTWVAKTSGLLVLIVLPVHMVPAFLGVSGLIGPPGVFTSCGRRRFFDRAQFIPNLAGLPGLLLI